MAIAGVTGQSFVNCAKVLALRLTPGRVDREMGYNWLDAWVLRTSKPVFQSDKDFRKVAALATERFNAEISFDGGDRMSNINIFRTTTQRIKRLKVRDFLQKTLVDIYGDRIVFYDIPKGNTR